MLATSAAQGETVDCTALTGLPVTINASGVYCLKANLNWANPAAARAIVIRSHDVVLDLNGFVLSASPVRGGQPVGISLAGRNNVTIRNGTIRGFSLPIQILPGIGSAGGANVVEGIRFDGPGSLFLGGANNIARRKLFRNSGDSCAISVAGAQNAVVDNDFLGPQLCGIAFGGSEPILVAGNRFEGVPPLFCLPPPLGPPPGVVVLRDNVSTDSANPFSESGCLTKDAGGNQ